MSFYNRQEKLLLDSKQSITVVGCGGIGWWVSKFAALSGIEEIYLFDPDTWEAHNLNRIDISLNDIGNNKAESTRNMILKIRPDISVYCMPYIYSDITAEKTNWVIDCTDKHESQIKNQEIAKKMKSRYVKAGYDGEDFSIHNSVAEWGESENGYRVVPSWVVPASIVAALTIGKIMKYKDKEVISKLPKMYKFDR